MLSVVIGAAANLVLDPVFILCWAWHPRRGGCHGAFAAAFGGVCGVFPALQVGIPRAAAALASAARQQALHRRYRQPWHSGLHHAADQQRGDDLLQQCAVRDRRRCVHLGHDDHFQRAPDGGNADLCHYRGLFPHYQLQLRRTPPPQGAARRRLHGPDGFGIHPYDLGGHSVGTALPHLHFQQRSHPAGGYHPRHELYFPPLVLCCCNMWARQCSNR